MWANCAQSAALATSCTAGELFDVPREGRAGGLVWSLGGERVEALGVARVHSRAVAQSGGAEKMTASSKTVQTDDTMETLSAVQRSHSAGALRMRQHRLRRQKGLRCLMVELRATEIDALVRKGLLRSETRNSPRAITEALYAFLDRTLVSVS
jgi:hypothetical protein